MMEYCINKYLSQMPTIEAIRANAAKLAAKKQLARGAEMEIIWRSVLGDVMGCAGLKDGNPPESILQINLSKADKSACHEVVTHLNKLYPGRVASFDATDWSSDEMTDEMRIPEGALEDPEDEFWEGECYAIYWKLD